MLVFRRKWLMYQMDDSLFTSNSTADIFPYSFHIRKNNVHVKL